MTESYFLNAEIKRYRKRPVVIEAVQISLENQLEVAEWCSASVRYNECLEINTLEGVMTAPIGSYIIKGIADEYYPCAKNIFEASYELVDGE